VLRSINIFVHRPGTFLPMAALQVLSGIAASLLSNVLPRVVGETVSLFLLMPGVCATTWATASLYAGKEPSEFASIKQGWKSIRASMCLLALLTLAFCVLSLPLLVIWVDFSQEEFVLRLMKTWITVEDGMFSPLAQLGPKLFWHSVASVIWCLVELWFVTMVWHITIASIVVEGKGCSEALKRCWSLSAGSRFLVIRSFAILSIVPVLIFTATFSVTMFSTNEDILLLSLFLFLLVLGLYVYLSMV